MQSDLLPSQDKGKSVDLKEMINAPSGEEAKKIFNEVVYVLSRPGLWHQTAGILSASFHIDGKKTEQVVEEGDHIRINIPGPGISEGDGDDWVKVENIDKNFDEQWDESYGLKLVVCSNPHTKGQAIAHFFAEGASSTFLVTRKGVTVTAWYKGRNEEPNTEELSLGDTLRNLIVAGGALSGISAMQWNALLKGLLSRK